MEYKLKYIDGCICTSLTVNDVETIDLSFDDMKNIVSKMINYIWKSEKDKNIICDIILYLLMEVGEEQSFKYSKYDIYGEIVVFNYYYDDRNYLTYISCPTDDFILVNELICDYTKLVRQDKWDNKIHCNNKNLMIIQSMLDKVIDFSSLQFIFCRIMECVGTYTSEYCECCGDNVNEYNLEI